jgi:membrane-bound serine protease (ClpP class)
MRRAPRALLRASRRATGGLERLRALIESRFHPRGIGGVLAPCVAAVLAVTARATPAPSPAVSPPRSVLAIRLEGAVTPVMAEVLDRALRRAESEKRAALVVEIDTPGGLESSMRVMIKRLFASEVPVITWVTPSGARAASAGVFIVMAADVAAMSPGTNIGAATPINLQGPMDSTLARKATNDAAAFARTVARQRGRSVSWAEEAVRRAVAASETEAVELHVVDFVAATMTELLERADGRTWTRKGEKHVIATRGLPVERMEAGFRLRFMGLLADPNVAYILMLLGFYGIMFELQNPGAILPGIVGGIALILAFFALSTLPVNYAGVALLVLAVVFFIAEIKVQSHGLLAAGGVLSMLLGSLLLFQGEGVRVSYGLVGGATLVTTAFFMLIVGAGLRAQRRPVASGAPGMIGMRGTVIERAAPLGRVSIGGVVWNARSREPAEVGSEVEVVAVDGLTVEVRPRTQEAHP